MLGLIDLLVEGYEGHCDKVSQRGEIHSKAKAREDEPTERTVNGIKTLQKDRS